MNLIRQGIGALYVQSIFSWGTLVARDCGKSNPIELSSTRLLFTDNPSHIFSKRRKENEENSYIATVDTIALNIHVSNNSKNYVNSNSKIIAI